MSWSSRTLRPTVRRRDGFGQWSVIKFVEVGDAKAAHLPLAVAVPRRSAGPRRRGRDVGISDMRAFGAAVEPVGEVDVLLFAENGRKAPEGLRESRHGKRRGSERILGHELQDLMSLSHSGYLSLSDRTRISGPCQSIVSAVSNGRNSVDVDSQSSAAARRRLTACAPVHRPARTPSGPASPPTAAARRVWLGETVPDRLRELRADLDAVQ